jgi:hypothetical protein
LRAFISFYKIKHRVFLSPFFSIYVLFDRKVFCARDESECSIISIKRRLHLTASVLGECLSSLPFLPHPFLSPLFCEGGKRHIHKSPAGVAAEAAVEDASGWMRPLPSPPARPGFLDRRRFQHPSSGGNGIYILPTTKKRPTGNCTNTKKNKKKQTALTSRRNSCFTVCQQSNFFTKTFNYFKSMLAAQVSMSAGRCW